MIGAVPLAAISLADLSLERTDPELLIRAAAAAGFGKVGLSLASATEKPLDHPILGRPETERRVRAALAETGLEVLDVEAFVLGPSTRIDTLRPAFELAASLGARYVLTLGDRPAAHDRSAEFGPKVELLARMAELAAPLGLAVGVEAMRFRDVPTWREALALVEACGASNVGVILDLLHFYRAGGRPEDLEAIPSGRLLYAQLADSFGAPLALEDLPREARHARAPLGRGVVPLHAILDRLPEGLPLAVETPVEADAHLPAEERARNIARATADLFARRSERTRL
ncbi:MAG: sugar phosphate isomerase/epimerase [Geminicoccaceae bacterium]|nr:sugar phosphate isomerase/epimerase [Geminicoccaceae bacterium]MCS7268605.1 sugar phosphate isomerase/epimerase [Geminicoccaceae bacterium]MCX7631255.1 sugar phosphate isomerase/epimerase [Geminicoccaceae bacterium]MDW8125334.1 sugar phosphate isomerase/epimerase family protein [Geminicoccaceae bacterium]MDW8342515.1 sugar phosphate isomerase/epimerase family protein [Geminicoccaceae bacterium]